MKKKIKAGFWEYIAGIVLRNRVTILVLVFLITLFLAFQWKNVGMTYNEANLLPKDHPANKDYTHFNYKGAKKIAGMLYDQLNNGYETYKILRKNRKAPKKKEIVNSDSIK